MERGLLWLPLLVGFFGLAWAGWNEFQKVQAYEAWAANFDRAKYDIYAVLGLQDMEITWGYPTRRGPINLQSFALATVETIRLEVNQNVIEDWDRAPRRGKPILKFVRPDLEAVNIPFTDIQLAIAWGNFLHKQLAAIETTDSVQD